MLRFSRLEGRIPVQNQGCIKEEKAVGEYDCRRLDVVMCRDGGMSEIGQNC